MSHHAIFTTLIMGAAVAEFGLTGLSGPSGEGASEAPHERTSTVAEQRVYPTTGQPQGYYAGAQPQGYPTGAQPQEYPVVKQQQAYPEKRDGPSSRIVPQDISAEHYSALIMEKIVPPVQGSGPPIGYQAPRAELATDIDNGVYYLDSSVRKIPGFAMMMVAQVEKHGIAALAYEDPEMKRAGHELGTEVGTGIRHLITAMGKDMVATAHESLGDRRR